MVKRDGFNPHKNEMVYRGKAVLGDWNNQNMVGLWLFKK